MFQVDLIAERRANLGANVGDHGATSVVNTFASQWRGEGETQEERYVDDREAAGIIESKWLDPGWKTSSQTPRQQDATLGKMLMVGDGNTIATHELTHLT